ncbi:MAG: hypothetical protein OEV15_03965, partial [Gallionella sp.]|nr:hypothetical protein [Gallionella sp.]
MKNNNYSTMTFHAMIFGLLLAVANAYAANVYAANVYAEERQVGLDWLKIVAFAGHQTNYTGIFVYQYDNHVETS